MPSTHYLFLLILLIQISSAIDEPLFYPEDFQLSQPINKFGGAIFCKLCDTILDILENKLPLKTLGKGPMMLAIRVGFF
jgi:hypothetical protein